MARTPHRRDPPRPVQAPYRRSPALPEWVREWYLVSQSSWLVRHLRSDFAPWSSSTFPGSDYLGPSEGLHGPNPGSKQRGNVRERRGERGEIRGCATKMADILRKRVVAWWGQHGEKLDGMNLGRVSMDTGRVFAREKKKNCRGESSLLKSRSLGESSPP